MHKLIIALFLFFISFNILLISALTNDNNNETNNKELYVYNESCLIQEIGRGKSMLPTMNESGKFIMNECVEPKNLEVGEIIVFRYELINGTIIRVVHRIIWISDTKKMIQTQGDNNSYKDRKINFSDYIGRVESW